MVEGKHGYAPCKTFYVKLLMVVDYCWCQQASRLGWVAPTYHKKEGATPHPGGHQNSLQYGGRPDWRLGEQIGMWNINGLSGKAGKCLKKTEHKDG